MSPPRWSTADSRGTRPVLNRSQARRFQICAPLLNNSFVWSLRRVRALPRRARSGARDAHRLLEDHGRAGHIAEYLGPQDGKLRHRIDGTDVELRAATMPTGRIKRTSSSRLLPPPSASPSSSRWTCPSATSLRKCARSRTLWPAAVCRPDRLRQDHRRFHSNAGAASIPPRPRSGRSKNPARDHRLGLRQVQVMRKTGSTSLRRRCGRSCGPIPTSSWSEKMRDVETAGVADRGIAHGAPGPLHAAYQHGAGDHHASPGDGPRGVQLRRLAPRRPGPAARSVDLRGLQRAGGRDRARARDASSRVRWTGRARECHRRGGRWGDRALERGRLRGLRWHRVPRALRAPRATSSSTTTCALITKRASVESSERRPSRSRGMTTLLQDGGAESRARVD